MLLCFPLFGSEWEFAQFQLHDSSYKMGLVCSRMVLEANWDLTRDIEPIICMAAFIACEICY